MPISKPSMKRRYNLDFGEDEERNESFGDDGDGGEEAPRRPRATRTMDLPPPPEISGGSGYSEIDGQQASTLQGRSSSPRLFVSNSGHPTVTQLKVYKMDNGVPVSLGAIDAEATEDDFVKAFAQSMPQPGEGRIQFRFRPIDEENRELGLESSFWIGDEHISIQRLRARQAATASSQSAAQSGFAVPQFTQPSAVPPEILGIFARMMDRSQVLAVDERERAQQYMNQVNQERLGIAQSTTTSLQAFAERVMAAEAERSAAAVRIEAERNKQAADSMSAFFATQLEMQREMQRQQAERDERERTREFERYEKERMEAERRALEAKADAERRYLETKAETERRAAEIAADAERRAERDRIESERKSAEAKADAERRSEEARSLSLSFVEREQMSFNQRMKEMELKLEREKQEREERWRREDERRERAEKEERDARERRERAEKEEKERRDRMEREERDLREKLLLTTLQKEKDEFERRERERQAETDRREKERQANAERQEKERQREHEMRMKMLEIEAQQKREHDERMAQLQQMQLSAAMQAATNNNAMNFEGLIGKVSTLLQSFGVEPKDVIQRIINPPIPPTDNTAAWADLAGRIMGTVGEVAKAKMIADATRERKMIGVRGAPVVNAPGQRPMIQAQMPPQPVQARQPQPVPAQARPQAQPQPQAQPRPVQPQPQAQPAQENPAPNLALPQQKAARTALRDLVAKLSKQPEDKWQSTITLAMTSEPAIYHYVQAVTVVKALEEAGANEDLSDRIIDALMDSPLVPDDLNYGVEFEDEDESDAAKGE